MKKLLITCLCIFALHVNAQKVQMDSNGNFFSQSDKKSSIIMTEKLYIDHKNKTVYPVYITDEGRYFIYKTSKKTGKLYKSYLKLPEKC